MKIHHDFSIRETKQADTSSSPRQVNINGIELATTDQLSLNINNVKNGQATLTSVQIVVFVKINPYTARILAGAYDLLKSSTADQMKGHLIDSKRTLTHSYEKVLHTLQKPSIVHRISTRMDKRCARNGWCS